MRLMNAWRWELGIGILEDNVFGQAILKPPIPKIDPLIEKRKEPRISFSLPVRYRQKGRQNIPWVRAHSIDISRNGVRLALKEGVSVGTEIDLDIKLPEIDKTVRLEGVIVWANPSFNGSPLTECGIAFRNLRKLSCREKLIYFMADKICSLAHRTADQYTARPAAGLGELERCFALLYREYLSKQYCEKDPSGLHYHYFNLLPESRTFVLEKKGRLLGTISLIPDSSQGLPLDSIYGRELSLLRKEGRKLAEVGLLALDRASFEEKTFSLTDFQKLTASFRLFKVMFDYARLAGGITDLVIGMHPKHKELYRYLQFQIAGPEKSYPGARGKPALLMHMDLEHTVRTVPVTKGAGSYFLKEALSKAELGNYCNWSARTVKDFLFSKRKLIHALSESQRQHLLRCYPGLNPSQGDGPSA